MALRLLISDALWLRIEPVLQEFKHAAGSPPRLSDRMFIEAVLYQARTGTLGGTCPVSLATGCCLSPLSPLGEARAVEMALAAGPDP